MRLSLVGLVLWVLSLTLIGLLPPADTSTFERVVPEDILALAVMTNIPAGLDFLDQVQLRQWLDLDSQALLGNLPDQLQDSLVSLFVSDAKSVWFFVHQLAQQENDSWRIHFTSLLVPRSPGGIQALEAPVEAAVTSIFGAENMETFEYQNIVVYRGKEPGQVLYQVRMPDYLLVSNSAEGWRKTLRTATGKEEGLSQDPSFQRVRNHLRIDEGFFLYFRANRLSPILPEFGYLIRWPAGRVSERYYEVPDH
jgi:hypothetical protein